MEIMQVVSDLVCTRRDPGIRGAPLRVLKDLKGKADGTAVKKAVEELLA